MTPRKLVDVRLPSAELRITAAPVATLKKAQVQAPEQDELVRLAKGFGGLLSAAEEMTERDAIDEGIRAVAEVEAMPVEELKAALESGELENDLDLRYGVSMIAVDARIGQVLASDMALTPEEIVALGNPMPKDEGEASEIVDKAIKRYIEGLPALTNPVHLASVRTGLADFKKSVLRDGNRRAAAQLVRTARFELRDEAKDLVLAWGQGDTDKPLIVEGLLINLKDNFPDGPTDVREGLVRGLLALVELNPDAALEGLEQLRQGKELEGEQLLEGEDYAKVRSALISKWRIEDSLKNGFKDLQKERAGDELAGMAMQWMRESKTESSNIADLWIEIGKSPQMTADLNAIWASYPNLNERERAAVLTTTMAKLTNEGSKAQALMDRNNKALDDEVKLAISATNGNQTEFDKIVVDTWTAEQLDLAESIFVRSKRRAKARIDADIERIIGDEGNLSPAAREMIQGFRSTNNTERIIEELHKGANAYDSPEGLWTYGSGEASRTQHTRRIARDVLSQFDRLKESISGESSDINQEWAEGEVDRIITERMGQEIIGWDEASREEKRAILNGLLSQPIDLVRDTQADDWIKLHAQGDRNQQKNADGTDFYVGQALEPVDVDIALGGDRGAVPELAEAIEDFFDPGRWSRPDAAKLRAQTNTPAFKALLESSPKSREIMAGLMYRMAPTTVNAVLNDVVGWQLIDGGLPLGLTVPLINGTKVPDLSTIFIDGLVPELEPALTGVALSPRGELLKQKLMEVTGLSETNFMLALPGIIQAQKANKGKWDKLHFQSIGVIAGLTDNMQGLVKATDLFGPEYTSDWEGFVPGWGGKFPGNYPTVANEDGSRSNVLLGTFQVGNKHFVIPTLVGGKVLSGAVPLDVAKKAPGGLASYPSFKTEAGADAWAKTYHGNVDEDGRMRSAPALLPVPPRVRGKFDPFEPK